MDYEIIFAKRKTVGIRVMPNGQVVVRAPKGTSKRAIGEIVAKHSAWISKRVNDVKEHPSLIYDLSMSELNNLKKRTEEIVIPLVEKYSAVMGLHPSKVNITSAKRVFGSCTDRGHLNFSFRLCLYPVSAIEYVVVHELSHMKEMNHSKRFWAVVEKYLPDYREGKKLLKENIYEHSNS